MLVIDTSSAWSGFALVRVDSVLAEVVRRSGRELDVAESVLALLEGRARPADLTAVAVATGPGSFTGLRSGISFGVGLAQGLGVPLLTLATLAIAQARAREPATAISEAGRGRVYFVGEDGVTRLAGASELPPVRPLVGWLRPASVALFETAGLRFLEESRLRSFGEAAAGLLGGAPTVPYGTVRPEYMSAFRGLA